MGRPLVRVVPMRKANICEVMATSMAWLMGLFTASDALTCSPGKELAMHM